MGTIIGIAGMALVDATAGLGGAALCFIPLLVIASEGPLSELPTDPQVAEVLNANP